MKIGIFVSLLFVLFTSNSYGQNGIAQKICDTIPYRIVHDKMIIPANMNGVDCFFIYDSGGQTGIMRDDAVRMKAKSNGSSRPVGDYGGNSVSYSEATIQNAILGTKFKLSSLKVMIFPMIPFFKELGVVGILGGDAFAQAVITIDSRISSFIINYPYRPDRLKIVDGKPMNSGKYLHTAFPVKFGDVSQEVIFDSGASGFLRISKNFYDNALNQPNIKNLENGYGIDGVGIGGVPKPDTLRRVRILELDFLGKKFKNIECTINKSSQVFIGLDIIHYGKLVIDYPRGLFYFIPFSNDVVESISLHDLWSVAILPVVDQFEITSIWDRAKDSVQFGERVLNINGTDLSNFPLNEMAIRSLLNKTSGNEAYIIIESKDKKQRKVMINRL